MSHIGFTSPTGMGMPAGGLASRRGGGQNIKPLSFDSVKSPTDVRDNGVPTPRTSRSHLLAGLRTAPKSATATSFVSSPSSGMPHSHTLGRNGMAGNMYGGQEAMYNGPKTSLPRMATQQQQGYNMVGMNQQHYTPEQILAPPELHLDEQIQDQMDPSLYAQLVATNMYLAQQQQRLQQQLLNVQAAAQQFQGLNINGQHAAIQQQMALQQLYQQEQQLKSLQQSINSTAQAQQNLYSSYYDPATGQTYIVNNQAGQMANMGNMGGNMTNLGYMDNTPGTPHGQSFQRQNSTPRVQVSPPPMENVAPPNYRTSSPPKKPEFTAEPTPLPPPSANAFRRGHKKSSSMANVNKGLAISSEDPPKTAGPKTASFPLTPMPNGGGYGPGQARAGEHPTRQPRGPPALDELRAKPTARHEGSKNFSARTRRSAVHNLVKAGMVRRKGTSSSCGSMSPVSESAEELGTPLTDNESDSGRSGSGSLSGDAEPSLASSRTSISVSWGAIGSERPGSRQKSWKSVDSYSSAGESESSFANVFKHGSQRPAPAEVSDGQRKAARLVLTSAEKRKGGVVA
ncbi:hypothetical protein F4778DRAFT_778473 [Xylariomycetidae sp. FL2044]|nr:hypothetical protein F4778DRAFT_778473 [Xylariomycetidae sp. FL2044]